MTNLVGTPCLTQCDTHPPPTRFKNPRYAPGNGYRFTVSFIIPVAKVIYYNLSSNSNQSNKLSPKKLDSYDLSFWYKERLFFFFSFKRTSICERNA